jgi:hypothetical protein
MRQMKIMNKNEMKSKQIKNMIPYENLNFNNEYNEMINNSSYQELPNYNIKASKKSKLA